MTKEEFIGYIGQIASRDWQARRICLPSVVIAQAILESGWGESELATKANAIFGIKKNGWTGETYVKPATEQRADGHYYIVDDTEWRAYEDWEQSIVDHNDYLATREKTKGVLRYKEIIGNSDYKAVCQLLKDCGYATSLTYPQKLINLIETYELTRFDKVVNNMKIIAIDAGHGRNTAGKRVTLNGYPDTREWALNDRIADRLEQMLADYECKVIRVDDTTGANDISLVNRVGKANSANADIYISIHHNAGIHGGSGGGTVVYYYSSDIKRRDQAQKLYNFITDETKLYGNRSMQVIKNAFYVLKNTRMPAFLIENGFMDSTTDVPIILSESHADKTAEGIRAFVVQELALIKKIVEEKPEDNKVYRVQVGAYSKKSNAETMQKKLKAAGFDAVIVTK